MLAKLHLYNTPQFHHFNAMARVWVWFDQQSQFMFYPQAAHWLINIPPSRKPYANAVAKKIADSRTDKARQDIFTTNLEPGYAHMVSLTWQGPRCQWRRVCSTEDAICKWHPCPAHWPVHVWPYSSAPPPCCTGRCVASARREKSFKQLKDLAKPCLFTVLFIIVRESIVLQNKVRYSSFGILQNNCIFQKILELICLHLVKRI